MNSAFRAGNVQGDELAALMEDHLGDAAFALALALDARKILDPSGWFNEVASSHSLHPKFLRSRRHLPNPVATLGLHLCLCPSGWGVPANPRQPDLPNMQKRLGHNMAKWRAGTSRKRSSAPTMLFASSGSNSTAFRGTSERMAERPPHHQGVCAM